MTDEPLALDHALDIALQILETLTDPDPAVGLLTALANGGATSTRDTVASALPVLKQARAMANTQAWQLALRLADALDIVRTAAGDDDDDDTATLSALDYALRGDPGCIEPAEWQVRRRELLIEHADYLKLDLLDRA